MDDSQYAAMIFHGGNKRGVAKWSELLCKLFKRFNIKLLVSEHRDKIFGEQLSNPVFLFLRQIFSEVGPGNFGSKDSAIGLIFRPFKSVHHFVFQPLHFAAFTA